MVVSPYIVPFIGILCYGPTAMVFGMSFLEPGSTNPDSHSSSALDSHSEATKNPSPEGLGTNRETEALLMPYVGKDGVNHGLPYVVLRKLKPTVVM